MLFALIAIAAAACAAVTSAVRAATRSPLYYDRYIVPWHVDSACAKIAWLNVAGGYMSRPGPQTPAGGFLARAAASPLPEVADAGQFRRQKAQ